MSLKSLDLNLLKVFEALVEERSVTRAGDVLGRSQPAVSNALHRLRMILKDDLFVRGGSGLVSRHALPALQLSALWWLPSLSSSFLRIRRSFIIVQVVHLVGSVIASCIVSLAAR